MALKKKKKNVAIAFDLSKAFDTIILHTLIHKLHSTNIPNIISQIHSKIHQGTRTVYTLVTLQQLQFYPQKH